MLAVCYRHLWIDCKIRSAVHFLVSRPVQFSLSLTLSHTHTLRHSLTLSLLSLYFIIIMEVPNLNSAGFFCFAYIVSLTGSHPPDTYDSHLCVYVCPCLCVIRVVKRVRTVHTQCKPNLLTLNHSYIISCNQYVYSCIYFVLLQQLLYITSNLRLWLLLYSEHATTLLAENTLLFCLHHYLLSVCTPSSIHVVPCFINY